MMWSWLSVLPLFFRPTSFKVQSWNPGGGDEEPALYWTHKREAWFLKLNAPQVFNLIRGLLFWDGDDLQSSWSDCQEKLSMFSPAETCR